MAPFGNGIGLEVMAVQLDEIPAAEARHAEVILDDGGVVCGVDFLQDFHDRACRRQRALERGAAVDDSARHAVHAVALDELRVFRRVDHVGADMLVDERELVGEVDHLRAIRTGHRHHHLEVGRHPDAARQRRNRRIETGLAGRDHLDGVEQGDEVIPGGDTVEADAVIPAAVGADQHRRRHPVDAEACGLSGRGRQVVHVQRQLRRQSGQFLEQW